MSDSPSSPRGPAAGTEPPSETAAVPTGWREQVANRLARVGASGAPLIGLGLVVVAALLALLLSTASVGPAWLGEVGAVLVVSAFSWALAARIGGRPVVFAGLALALGVVVVAGDMERLRTGAAVMTCVVASVLAVMATVPAVRFVTAARECLVAVLVAGIGALAAVGFEPTITVARFEYATFALSLVGVFAVVFRLGAGFHGLGRRGAVAVVIGALVLVVTLLYAELLRRYGTPGLVESSLDAVRWSRDELGAFPRPSLAVLGVPALVWGTHMRARRRQGWWVCAFGVAGTSAVANSLANPTIMVSESVLSVVYGLAVGLVIGFVVIRLDLAVTGSGGSRRRAAEEAAAVRPEPRRIRPLL